MFAKEVGMWLSEKEKVQLIKILCGEREVPKDRVRARMLTTRKGLRDLYVRYPNAKVIDVIEDMAKRRVR